MTTSANFKTNNKDHNNLTLDDSLKKVTKGALIIFAGSIIGLFLAFVGRVIVARFFTQSEYGIFSLGYVLLHIFVTIGTLGLMSGTARYMAYYRAKRKEKEVKKIASWSIKLSLMMGTPLCILVFLFSDLISIKIFHSPALSLPLKIFSITIPFLVSLSIFTAIFRGFGRTKEQVYFYDLLRNLLFPLFLVPIIFFGLAFVNAIVAYFASIAVTCIAFAVYYVRKCPKSLRPKDESKFDTSIAKGLLLFSIPLLFVDVLYLVIGWTDTLMLGYFKTAGDIGLYNAVNPLAHFISMALTAVLFIYIPVASELYAKNQEEEMKRSYAVLTKWICSATLPLFMIFLLFPEVTIIFLFGSEYILAGTTLQILAFGFFTNNLMGPNGATLIAIGKTRFLMWATLAAAVTNICLNVLLIPILGILGAAIASMITMISINVITSAKLYLISGIHSISKNLLKPILLSIILIFAIYLAAESFLTVTFWMLPLLFILFAILYGLSLLFTKSFDQEDINMLLTIEKKMGINFNRIKNLLKRFV